MIDSNQIAALIVALEAKAIPVLTQPVVPNHDWMNPQVIGAIVMVAAAAAGYLQSRTAAVNAREAKETAKENKVVTEETAKSVSQIHTLVNSKETATAAELKRLGDIVLTLTQENATQAQRILEHDKSDVRLAERKDAAIAKASES